MAFGDFYQFVPNFGRKNINFRDFVEIEGMTIKYLIKFSKLRAFLGYCEKISFIGQLFVIF